MRVHIFQLHARPRRPASSASTSSSLSRSRVGRVAPSRGAATRDSAPRAAATSSRLSRRDRIPVGTTSLVAFRLPVRRRPRAPRPCPRAAAPHTPPSPPRAGRAARVRASPHRQADSRPGPESAKRTPKYSFNSIASRVPYLSSLARRTRGPGRRGRLQRTGLHVCEQVHGDAAPAGPAPWRLSHAPAGRSDNPAVRRAGPRRHEPVVAAMAV